MAKIKKNIIVFIISGIFTIAIVTTIIIFTFSFLRSSLFASDSLIASPKQPEISYAEFPFKIEYEYNGEVTILEDALVIEHKGVSAWSSQNGKKNNLWEISLKNNTVKLYFCDVNGSAIPLVIDGENKILMYLGSCEYYMGLDEIPYSFASKNISTGDILFSKEDNIITNEEKRAEYLNKYEITIIKKEISAPITNKQ